MFRAAAETALKQCTEKIGGTGLQLARDSSGKQDSGAHDRYKAQYSGGAQNGSGPGHMTPAHLLNNGSDFRVFLARLNHADDGVRSDPGGLDGLGLAARDLRKCCHLNSKPPLVTATALQVTT